MTQSPFDRQMIAFSRFEDKTFPARQDSSIRFYYDTRKTLIQNILIWLQHLLPVSNSSKHALFHWIWFGDDTFLVLNDSPDPYDFRSTRSTLIDWRLRFECYDHFLLRSKMITISKTTTFLGYKGKAKVR